MTDTALTERWDDIERVESWAGEVRVNLIRLIAIIAFYLQHLLNVYCFSVIAPNSDIAFHVRATLLAVSWATVVASLYFVLRTGQAHPAIKYLATLWDVIMICALIALTGQPRGAFFLLFLLPIGAATLRLSLPLVYVATSAAALGYMAVLAHYAWFIVGTDKYYTNTALRVPLGEQIIVLLVILTAGLLAGQSIRQTRRIARAILQEGNMPS